MNHTAIDYTARVAAAHRADVAAGIRAAREARRVGEADGRAVPQPPAPRRHVWGRWLPSARPAQ